MNRTLRNWAFFCVAAIALAVIGCGGSDDNSGSTGGTPTGGGTGLPLTAVLRPEYGTIDFTYLTGQGRRAPGDLFATVSRLGVRDSSGQVRTESVEPVSLPLNSYVLNRVSLNVPFSGQAGRTFEQFTLGFQGFSQESATGSPITLTPPAETVFPALIRVVPGRTTSLPIFLDDSMFSIGGANDVTLVEDQFRLRNGIPLATDVIQTFFSDYVGFDISGLAAADRPQLTTGASADVLLVSGDNYALADLVSGTVEVLTLDETQPVGGSISTEGSIPGTPGSLYRFTPGTYTLRQADPSDLTGLAQITALAGIWRDFNNYFRNISNFEFILFPTSRTAPPSDTADNGLRPDEDQEVIVVQSARDPLTGKMKATNVYFGYADLATRRFSIFPLRDITSGAGGSEITGTIGNFVNGNGVSTADLDRVRRGTFTFTGTTPAGFASTGTFLVFRQ